MSARLSFDGPLETISRKDAISRGLKLYFTGKPCWYGHTAPRKTAGKSCVECSYLDGSTKRRQAIEDRKAIAVWFVERDHLILSSKQAKKSGLMWFFTGSPLPPWPHGHEKVYK